MRPAFSHRRSVRLETPSVLAASAAVNTPGTVVEGEEGRAKASAEIKCVPYVSIVEGILFALIQRCTVRRETPASFAV